MTVGKYVMRDLRDAPFLKTYLASNILIPMTFFTAIYYYNNNILNENRTLFEYLTENMENTNVENKYFYLFALVGEIPSMSILQEVLAKQIPFSYVKLFLLVLCYNYVRYGPAFRLWAHHQTLAHKESHCEFSFFQIPYLRNSKNPALKAISDTWDNSCYAKNMLQWTSHYLFGGVSMVGRIHHVELHHRNYLEDACTSVDLDRSSFTG